MTTRMAKIIQFTAVLAIGAGLSSTQFINEAEANPRCSNHERIVSHLDKKYGEKPRGIGLVSDKGVMQVLVSEKGTWTILVTNPDGRACLIAAGQGWEDIAVKFEKPEA